MNPRETAFEPSLIATAHGLKYDYRQVVRNRTALEQNFRDNSEALERVHLTDREFAHLRDKLVTPRHL